MSLNNSGFRYQVLGSVFQLISDWEDAEDEFSVLRETAAKTGAKGTFTLLDLANQPNLWHEQLRRIESAQKDGLDIRAQVLSPSCWHAHGAPCIYEQLLLSTHLPAPQ